MYCVRRSRFDASGTGRRIPGLHFGSNQSGNQLCSAGRDFAGFQLDQLIQDEVVRDLEIIGEAANRIRKVAPDFVSSHPELPWIEMRGMRNKMIHDYFDVDWRIVWDTVKNDLPGLKRQIESVPLMSDRAY